MVIVCYVDHARVYFLGWNGYAPTWTVNPADAIRATNADFRQLRRLGYQPMAPALG